MKRAETGEGAQIGLPPELFAAAFPFHVAVDETLTILQVGATLGRLCPDVSRGARFDALFRPLRPEGRIDLKWILDNRSFFFLLEHQSSRLQLRGEFVFLEPQRQLLFLGSPWFTDADEIAARGLRFEDFAIHDPVVDLLHVFQASRMALKDAKKLAAKLSVQREELRTANQLLDQRERESRKLALIAARTDNAVVLTDAAGLVVWVNEGFTRLTGYTLEEMLGRTPGSVLQGPGTDPETVRRMSDRLRRGDGFTEEIVNYHKDGREYWVAVEVQPIADEAGEVSNFMAIESDVTARRAEQQRLAIQFEVASVLAESDNLATAMRSVLRVIAEHLGWQVGQTWRVVDSRLEFIESWHAAPGQAGNFDRASRAACFARGEGLPGRVWASGAPCWVPDVTRDAAFPRARFAAADGLHGALAFPVTVRGQIWGVAEFFSSKIQQPDSALLQIFSTIGVQVGEFVARWQVQDELLKSEERFRLALAGADLGTWDIYVPTGEMAINARYLEMLGRRPGEIDLCLASWATHLHPDDSDPALWALAEHLRGASGQFESEYRMRHRSGQWVWILSRGRVIERDPAGRPLRVCGTHLDVTFRKVAENALREEKALLEEARLRELQTGYEIQRSLLIGELPTGVAGIDIGAFAVPSRGIDGDFFAFTTFRPDCLEILVGDVMGKGVPAALIGAGVRTTYHQVVTELLAASLPGSTLPRPAEIVNSLHARLTPRLIELDTFVTLALYRFDLAGATLSFVNGGHTPGLLRHDGGAIDDLLGENVPLGVVRDEVYLETTLPLHAGDLVLAYSDGITEARSAAGEEFGEPRLRRFLDDLGSAVVPAPTAMQALRKRVQDHVGDRPMVDDQTAVVIRLRDLANSPAGHAGHSAMDTDLELPWDLGRLSPLRRHVAAAGSALPPDALDRLVLAAFEAATNVIRHVASPFAEATLLCHARADGDRTTIELWYVGLPFAPNPGWCADLSGVSEGGFGLYLIEHAVSEVRYEQPLAGICCTRLVQMAGLTTAIGPGKTSQTG